MSYAMLKIGAMAVNLNLLSSDFFALLVGLFIFHYKVSVSSVLMCTSNETVMSCYICKVCTDDDTAEIENLCRTSILFNRVSLWC